MIIEKLNKKCLNCDITIYKPQNESLKNWINRHKYCSKHCSFIHRGVGKNTRFKNGMKAINPIQKGQHLSPSTQFKKGMKISEEVKSMWKGRTPWNKGKPFLQIRGEKNFNWRGGITPLYRDIRNLLEMKVWIINCMKRDNFICQECGRKRCKGDRVILEVHHIIPFRDIIKNNNIKTLDEARNCKKLWDTDNGKTLCLECHNKTRGSNQYVN